MAVTPTATEKSVQNAFNGLLIFTVMATLVLSASEPPALIVNTATGTRLMTRNEIDIT